jgi:ActR/RegA family two-component response regulator
LEFQAVWTEVVRALRCTLPEEPRRRIPYGGTRAAEGPSAPTEESNTESRHLLVAGDESGDRARTARYFRSLGWTVDVGEARADSGVEARGHDLAIVELVETQAQAGLERLQDIRRRQPQAAVIVLGDLSPALETHARALGASAVLGAPRYLPDLGHLAFALTGIFHG